jgi:hypothetical protein
VANKHHYIPRFYLKGFEDPSSRDAHPREPYLWVVDLKLRNLNKRAPKNVARLTGYYDFEEAQDQLPSVENFLSRIETRAASAIRKLRAHKFQISDEERYNLANFMGLQLARVPAYREVVEVAMKQFAHKWLREYVMDDTRLKRRLKEYISKRGYSSDTLSPESIREYVLEGRLDVSPSKNYLIDATLRAGLNIFAPLIFVMRWTFVLASDRGTFFTSDNPVALLSPDAQPIPINLESISEELEISFPISPSCVLLAHSHDEHIRLLTATSDTITEINRRVFPTVKRFIFCSTRELGNWALGSHRRA